METVDIQGCEELSFGATERQISCKLESGKLPAPTRRKAQLRKELLQTQGEDARREWLAADTPLKVLSFGEKSIGFIQDGVSVLATRLAASRGGATAAVGAQAATRGVFQGSEILGELVFAGTSIDELLERKKGQFEELLRDCSKRFAAGIISDAIGNESSNTRERTLRGQFAAISYTLSISAIELLAKVRRGDNITNEDFTKLGAACASASAAALLGVKIAGLPPLPAAMLGTLATSTLSLVRTYAEHGGIKLKEWELALKDMALSIGVGVFQGRTK